jgi:hypothetical protein
MRRISIRTLMVVVIMSAIFLAALRNADDTWATPTTFLAVACIGLGVVWARALHGRERAWWFGFAAVGGAYLAVSLSPLKHGLFMTHLLDFVHARVCVSTIRLYGTNWSDRDTVSFMVAYADGAVRNIDVPTSVVNSKSTDDLLATFEPAINRWRSALPGAVNRGSFQRVGQNLFSLLAGLIGGTAFAWFYGTRGVSIRGNTR